MSLYVEGVTPSTTWAWKRVKMARPPEARDRSTAGRGRFRLPRRNPRVPLAATLKLRGGPECWVEVHARGEVYRMHGATAVYDLVMAINNCQEPAR